MSRTIPRDVVTFCAALAACDLRLQQRSLLCELIHGFLKDVTRKPRPKLFRNLGFEAISPLREEQAHSGSYILSIQYDFCYIATCYIRASLCAFLLHSGTATKLQSISKIVGPYQYCKLRCWVGSLLAEFCWVRS